MSETQKCCSCKHTPANQKTFYLDFYNCENCKHDLNIEGTEDNYEALND